MTRLQTQSSFSSKLGPPLLILTIHQDVHDHLSNPVVVEADPHEVETDYK